MPKILQVLPASSPGIKRKGKPGLRRAQIRILALLVREDKFLNHKTICEQAPADKVWMADALYGRLEGADENIYITEATPKAKEYAIKIGYPSLLQLGYVRGVYVLDEAVSEWLWEATEAGKQALAAQTPNTDVECEYCGNRRQSTCVNSPTGQHSEF